MKLELSRTGFWLPHKEPTEHQKEPPTSRGVRPKPVSVPARRCMLGTRRCIFGVKNAACQQSSVIFTTRKLWVIAAGATMPASDPARQRPSPLGAASRARQVHLGIKTGAFYGQEATMPARCVLWSRRVMRDNRRSCKPTPPSASLPPPLHRRGDLSYCVARDIFLNKPTSDSASFDVMS